MLDTVWSRTLSSAERETLNASDSLPRRAEVVIIGAGLVGLSSAYALVESGLTNVCIVDRSGPAAEASGANAGGLWFAQQSPELAPIAELAKLSNRLYDELGQRFECELARRGGLDLVYGPNGDAEAAERVSHIAAAGYRGEVVERKRIREVEPELSVEASAVLLPEDGQVHPVRLAAALAGYVRQNGVRICRGVDVHALGKPLETSAGALHADRVVIAAGAWTPLLTAALGWKPPIEPVRGTLLALPKAPRRIHHTVMAERYYYWQLECGPIVGGGSEERVGFEPGSPSEVLQDIRAEMGAHFPALAHQPTEVAWYGFRPYCADHRPVIGAAPGSEDLFVAAGHFRKGVMLAPASGQVVADLLLGRAPRADISTLDPGRFVTSPA
ncbi:MAG: FAD-binding oxidoreductase [Acidobacteria bacterium]|nr:FAD-binding oxidoreductase [Acidobacteriota bacterium]